MEDMCLISDVEYDESFNRPVILNFENGTIQSGQENNLVCQMYMDQHNRNNFVVTAATENSIYRGAVSRDDLYNNFIAVRDKKTNKMRLIAIDYATLSPLIEGQKDSLNTSLLVANSTTSELNKQFGSKRAKRQTEQRERMQMDIENVREQLEKTVADVKVEAADLVQHGADENDSYRPPINRDTDKIEDVYSLDEIISSDILNTVSEELNRISEAADEEMGTCPFVTQEIKKLQNTSSSDVETRAQILLYIDCLIKFMICPAKSITTKKYTSCSYSEAVHADILQKFTVQSAHGRLRPTVMRDKCMCYILVLGMMACGYSLDLAVLAKELKTGIKKLQDVSKILAFNVGKEIATLKLPLPAPVSNIKRGKKKKR